jgi:hypothetical protein
MSGWQDSNLRPPGPKPGAIPDYATSRGRSTKTRTWNICLEGRSYIPLTIDPNNTIVFESFLFNFYALRLVILLSSLSSRESNVL